MCLLHISKFRKNLGILVLAFHLNRIRVRDGGLSPSWSLVQGNLCLSALESFRDSKVQVNSCDSNTGFR